MNILKSSKIAKALAVGAMIASAFAPLAASAQFALPEVEDTGLPESSNISEFIIYIINILLGIVGLIAVLFLIIGGFRYVTAGGNEETAEAGKKTIINAIIGIIIIILSFVIVRVVAAAFLGL